MKDKNSRSFFEIVKQICTRWFIDAFSGMAQGLFVTLIAGTIVKTIGSYIIGEDTAVGAFLTLIGGIASVVTGFGIGVGMANALKSDKLVAYSAGVAGFVGAYADKILAGAGLAELSAVWGKGLPGNPISAYVCALLAIEVARLVSGKTKLDILLVPLTCIACAIAGVYLSYPFIWLIGVIGEGIRIATTATPVVMVMVIAVVMGMLLTLPTSSAAIWVTIASAYGQNPPDAILIAGGAAVVGCASHMVGFAVMSFRENGVGGLISQGLGTSMLQIPNVMKKPILFIPPVISSLITGPLATKVFEHRCNAAGGGMGTSGLVGVFGVIDASAGKLEPWLLWLGIILLMFILPALICFLVSEFMRKKGWIKLGDLKLK